MKCKLCASSILEPKFLGIVQCKSCGLLFYPLPVYPEKIYSETYFNGTEYHDYGADKPILQKNFQDRLKDLLAIKASGDLYEIGCAYGYFLELARTHFKVSGIDISHSAIKQANISLGDLVKSGNFLTEAEPTSLYDFICMWDVIEHLEEPFLYLEQAAKWLKPGARLFLTTGDAGSMVARWRGQNWRQIHPPSHLFYFTHATISEALKRAGLKLVRIRSIGQYRSYKSMMYGIFWLRLVRLKWIYSLLTFGGRIDFPVYLNLGDLMLVEAEKV